MNPLFGVGFELLSPFHLMIILGLGVLLFGKRLPEIGRSLGKGIVEFKKGLKGLEDEVEMNASPRHESPARPGAAASSSARDRDGPEV